MPGPTPIPRDSVVRCPRPLCGLQWVTRVEQPKACPNCRYRFRYSSGDPDRVPKFVRHHRRKDRVPGRGGYA